MSAILRRFLRAQAGATAIEYSLIASLVAMAIITSASNLGKNVGNTFGKVQNNMTTK